ncbi:LuxR family transcriptional regulator [Rhizobium sp. RU36D]|uniref:helix-turn-helix transcriptional regulator n=1 Tax=Rhizobium sp. RU36D TaxID=1907415 RepID=UPI0009D81FB3|nr:LuxR family transcriptional regulator [Rhizobium sp. RU36D]SMC40155.1 DNA-binding transcriptional regulator, CsgD family [Rhizobium sp. RU36D]
MYRSSGSASLRAAEDSGRFASADARSEGLNALGRQFVTLAEQNGMSHFVLTRFPHGDQPEFAANYVMGNWPADLQAIYSASDSYGFSKLISRLKESIVPTFSAAPIFLSESGGRDEREQALAFNRYGLFSHLAFSLHDADHRQYVVVFSGQAEGLSRESIASMYLGSLELLDIQSRRTRHHAGPKERLSARELECLRWTAAGKSSEEIAIILSISSHTVVSYLKSAMRKLDSVNRMQAIARACRFRLL